jgi:adsorption protein B
VSPDIWILALAVVTVLARELLWITGIGILLSSLDDLAMDAAWAFLVLPRGAEPLPPSPPEPARFAILVPAWDEADVIAPMLRALLATLSHPNFTVFVGVYPNDPATRAEVEAVADPRVHVIVTGRPGPTSKADCLNHLWRGVIAHEAETGRRFTGMVLHDAEDVVHPQELDLFERYLPHLALVQIPVLPFPDRRSPLVSGHYIDEFAEAHSRDMMVRARLGAAVPSAGVGTAFCRDALARIAGPANAPFNPAALTEDYEIAHRLHRLGLRGRMVRHRVGGRLVATREYFPATVEAAVRQKSRWLTGIALSGWDQLGWTGPLAHRWLLLRDRKGLLTSALAVLAYGTAVLVLAEMALRALLSWAGGADLPPLLSAAEQPVLLAVLIANTVLLLWRVLLRAGFTLRDHGLAQGLLAPPRAVVGNLVNALAALRAIGQYRKSVKTGTPPTWDKTAHRFPADVTAALQGPTHG